jgi:TonB-dependent receptor-like protein/carboxypeptidase family protein
MTPRWKLRSILTCVILCAVTTSTVGQQPATIGGQILDSLSHKPVTMAEIRLLGTAYRGSTDLGGRFAIRSVPPGIYALEARRIGYEPLVSDSIRIAGDTAVSLALVMNPSAFQLKEITVTPGSFSFMGSGPATRQTMTRLEIESVSFGEDLFRAVNRLPGLSSGDYAAHFSIRGGRHDETLILLDGLELFEPYHMKDFNEGALSIVDVGAIEGVELLTGGFPAKYGDKRSGVFNITSRTPAGDGTHFNLGLSFTNAHALAEGTFARDKGSWLVSARRGYVDLVLRIINKNELPSPRYEDAFAAVRYNIHPRHALSLNLLHAGDRYTFNADATTGFGDSIRTREIADNRYGNSYAWVTLQSLVGQRLGVRTMASAGLITAGRDGTERYLDRPGAVYAVTNTRDFSVLAFKQDWTYEHSNSMILEFGYDLRTLHADYGLESTVGQNPDDPSPDTLGYYPQVTRTAIKPSGTTIGTYLSNRLQLLNPLTVELGVRYDHASYTRDRDISPRVNLLFRLSERSTLRAGWGHYRQRQGIADLAVEDLDGPTRYFPSELSRQSTLGFEHLFPDGGMLRVEGYYKTGSRLRPIYRNWKGGIDVFPESNEDRILVFPDRTTSKGFELYHDRNFGSRWSLRAGYALAFVDEQVSRIQNVNDPTPILFDRTQPGPQDQRHAVNLDLTYRPGKTWSINGSWAFHTGWPATTESAVQVTGSNGQADVTVKPDKLYGSRLPSYQRLDVRVTRRKPTKNGELRFFFEVVNFTNHQNVLGYDYFRARDPSGGISLRRDLETWFTILPSLGISWSGRF